MPTFLSSTFPTSLDFSMFVHSMFAPSVYLPLSSVFLIPSCFFSVVLSVFVSECACPVDDYSTQPRFPSWGRGPFLSGRRLTRHVLLLFFCVRFNSSILLRWQYLHPTPKPPPLPRLGTGTRPQWTLRPNLALKTIP